MGLFSIDVVLKMESSETVIIWWLFGAVGFMSLLLMVIVCLCVSQRSRYARKLKAVTTSAVLDSTEKPAKDDSVPNTNRHATEGSNPVWMTGAECKDWEFPTQHEGNQTLNEMFTSNLDSLDTNVLNGNLGGRVVMEPEDVEDTPGFYVSGDVMYRCRGEELRAASADRHSDSSGRGSLFGSSQFVQSRNESLQFSKPYTSSVLGGERLNNPRAFSRDLDSD